MLNNFRNSLQPILKQLGKAFSIIGIRPNVWTYVSFIFAIIAGIVYAKHEPYSLLLGSIFVLFSGFFDIVDGQVARFSKLISKKGEFMDSVLDRISESAIYFGILIGNYTDNYIVVLALVSSFLVSYLRSKSESMQIQIQGIGIGERAERLVIMIILGIAGFIEIALIVIIFISLITIFQRMYSVLRYI